MRILIAFLLLLPLATDSQFQSLFRNEVSVVVIGILRTSECVTPENMVEDSLGYKKDPMRVLTSLNDAMAVHFVQFYNELHKQTPRTTVVVVADEIVVFDRERASNVLVTLYKDDCLVASAILGDELFNTIMGKIGVEERKFIPLKPGERDT